MVSSGFRNLVVDQMGSRSPNSDHDHFSASSLALRSALELLLGPATELVVASCCVKYTAHQISLIKKWFVVATTRGDDTSKWRCFLFLASSWGTYLSSFFTFPVCFKCWVTIEWLTLSSSATSPVVVGRWASMIVSVGRCQHPMTGHCCSSSGLSSPLQNFLSHQRTVLAVPRPNVLSMLQVVLAAWWPIFDPSWIRKSLKLAFHLTSFP